MVRTQTVIDKCSVCNAENELRITLTKRVTKARGDLKIDKVTSKLARTAYWCTKSTCADIVDAEGNIGTFNERELKRDLDIDFVW